MNQCHLLAVGAIGILATFQYAGIAAFETERENIEGHIRPSLVDHPNNTEGHTNATKTKTVGQRLLLRDMSEGRRQGGDVPHIGSDTLQAALRQLETVIERIVSRHLGQILGIRLQDSHLIIYYSVGNSIQYFVALLVAQQGQTFASPFYFFKCFFQLHGVNSVCGVDSG